MISTRLRSSQRWAWIAVAVYLGFSYGTLSLAYEVYLPVLRRVGVDWMSSSINLVFVATGLLLAIPVLRADSKAGALAALLLIGLVTAFTIGQLPKPAKRLHFFQYAPLTLLIFHAVGFRCRNRYRYLWTIVLVALAGLGDEVIQGWLPRRHFGMNDIVVNAVAGLLTLAYIGFVIGDRSGMRTDPKARS